MLLSDILEKAAFDMAMKKAVGLSAKTASVICGLARMEQGVICVLRAVQGASQETLVLDWLCLVKFFGESNICIREAYHGGPIIFC